MNSRSGQFRLSLTQGILYIVTEASVKTTKSVLLPSAIKQLTNNREIMNTIYRFGQGVSFLILSEMYSQNACIIRDQQQRDAIMSLNSQKESFAIHVANNIDRKEETFLGINSFYG